ncbi:CinA family protein [Halorubrum vacuolatum]|uniref:Nicotinamide-nucleotide amidase n=1 Tax=Halorubrum vacuolatum TaxID=63740 RepID=A0A238X267_HALVU|nr:CinA family protein [Halorubrum vacuolatum]SNR52790.1 nicotinamide-nucleotide amidase [Halorubrum vacuolatum]
MTDGDAATRGLDGDPDADRPPAVVLGDLLRERGETLAAAESLTGGLVSARIVDVPGASDYFDRGFVTYAYDAKREVLGVARETLDAHGAVSAPVAREMAARARDRADVTWAVSTTGIAGPGGGREGKPVGLVYVGVAYAAPWETDRSFARSTRLLLTGDRDAIREGSVDGALSALLAAVRDVASHDRNPDADGSSI